MFNKNCLLFCKSRTYTRIEVRFDEAQYNAMTNCIMAILRSAVKGRNLFVTYYGNHPELICPDYVIAQKIHFKRPLQRTQWMRETWLDVTDGSFMEERYVVLYLFDRDYTWEMFLNHVDGGLRDMLKTPQLQVLASFGECQFPCLYLKRGHFAEEKIFEAFRRKGFTWKRSIG